VVLYNFSFLSPKNENLAKNEQTICGLHKEVSRLRKMSIFSEKNVQIFFFLEKKMRQHWFREEAPMIVITNDVGQT
jgi:hypothetical protein